MVFKITIEKTGEVSLSAHEAKILLAKISSQLAETLATHDFSSSPFVFEVDSDLESKRSAFKRTKERLAQYKGDQSLSLIYQDLVINEELMQASLAHSKEFSISLNQLARSGNITFQQVRALNILQVEKLKGIGAERAIFIVWLFGLES